MNDIKIRMVGRRMGKGNQSSVTGGKEAPPCTQSAFGGEAVRQRAEIRGQRSEERCEFVMQDADGKWLTPHDCPEIGVGGDGCGVKTVPQARDLSPRLGGITACLQDNGHLWRMCRGVNGVNAEASSFLKLAPPVGMAPPCTPFSNPGNSRMGFEVNVTRCSGRIRNAFTKSENQAVGPPPMSRHGNPRVAGRRGFPEGRLFRRADHRLKQRMKDPTESWALASEYRYTREGVACAGRALTGLMGVFDGLTWACARRTRSSPGFHIWGLQPQRQNSAMHPHYLRREITPELPKSSLGFRAEITDGELIMNVKTTVCSPMARRNEGVATRELRG